MSVFRYELKIKNGNIVESFDDEEYTIFIFQNPASVDGSDRILTKIKTMQGNYVILNISPKVCNIHDLE